MKGVHGLILAIGLGVAGALCNWFYVHQKASGFDQEEFVGVRPGAAINQGDALKREDLVAVAIPKDHAGNLRTMAVLFKDIETVVGMKATRNYNSETGEMLLLQDLKTPPPELKLKPNERAMWIPVDTKTIVPSLIVPGEDKVSFLIPRLGGADGISGAGTGSGGTRAASKPGETPNPEPMRGAGSGQSPTATAGVSDVLGPFTVLAVGNRLGSPEVFKAARSPQVQENVILISVQYEGDKLEPRAEQLWNRMRTTNFREVGVLLHPRTPK